MSKLWHNEDPIRWLPDDFPADIINPKVAVSYLLCAAEFNSRVDRSCRHGSKVRIVFNPYDIDSCALCKEYDGKEFTQADFPNLPLQGCTSETGCKCNLETVWEERPLVELGFDLEEIVQEVIVDRDPVTRLKKLKEMYDLDLISEEEYNQKKAQILEEL